MVGVIFWNLTSYVIVAAGISFVYGIIADILTWDYNTDLNRHWLAESSWYLQIANFVLTIVAGLLSLLPAFVNNNSVLFVTLSYLAASVGVIGGITGAIFDIATLDLWNYFEFGIVSPNYDDPFYTSSGSVTVTDTETETVVDPFATIWNAIAPYVEIKFFPNNV